MDYWGVADPRINDDGCLVCPCCSSYYLDHCTVATLKRNHEDSPKGDIALISGLDYWASEENKANTEYSVRISKDFPMTENPSHRRGAVVTEFICEECGAKPQLAIIQHKGCTYLEWVEITSKPKLEPEPATKRQPIKPSIRFQVLKRDGYRCQMCGVTAQDGAKLEIDHIHPVSKGGGNELSNLQVLCRDCNAGKRDQLL